MKTIKLLTILVLVSSFTTLQAQWRSEKVEKVKGDGNVVTKAYQTSNYEEVLVAGNFYVSLTEGVVGNVTLKAEENLIKHIIIETKDNALHIKIEDKINLIPGRGQKIEVLVPVSILSKVSLAGSGEIHAIKTIKSDALNIRVAGSGNIKMPIETQQLNTSVAGSGNIILKGSAQDVKGSIAGSGDVEMFEVRATNAEVSIAGSGNFKLFCNGSLSAKIAGSGNVLYKGNPETLKTKEVGSGKVKAL